jgi:hypothetical protein
MMRLLPGNRAGKLRLLALFFILAVVAYFNRAQCNFYLTRAPVLHYYFSYSPHEGDVVFQSLPHGDLVNAIEGITHSPYSHCGVVLRNDKHEWVVIEAIASVHETPLLLWMLRGRNGDFTAYRLDPKYNPLIPEFKKNLLLYKGRRYDFDYDMTNDNSLYCSDLVYLAFNKASGEQMGKLEKLGDLDWKPYEHFIKSEQGGALPLYRLMITPASLARAPQIKEVYHGGL